MLIYTMIRRKSHHKTNRYWSDVHQLGYRLHGGPPFTMEVCSRPHWLCIPSRQESHETPALFGVIQLPSSMTTGTFAGRIGKSLPSISIGQSIQLIYERDGHHQLGLGALALSGRQSMPGGLHRLRLSVMSLVLIAY